MQTRDSVQASAAGRFLVWVMLAAAAFPPFAAGQEARAAAASPLAALPEPAGPDDPAFTLYRQGYSAVLAEQWTEARAAFAELARRFPGSRFADDAAYWTAFSWKRSDPDRAARLYRQLLRDYPQSPYLDDAVSDLRLLEVESEVARIRTQIPPPHTGEPLVVVSEELQRLRREIDRQRKIMQWNLQREMTVLRERDTLFIRAPLPPPDRPLTPPAAADPEIRVRIEVLRSLAARKPEPEVYATLREVALDREQPVMIRVTALHTLGEFARRDSGTVFLDLARGDADPDIQRIAIELYARSLPDKRKAVDGLVTLFRRFDTGEAPSDVRLGTTLYAIASIGDERATDFLAHVARSHRNEEIRSGAVFYLGAIGNDRARTALIRLLKGE